MAQFGSEIMDFVQRMRTIQAHRDASDLLMKDLLLYAETLENSLRTERANNTQLLTQLNEKELDLLDAVKSRRELQLHLHDVEKRAQFRPPGPEIYRNRNPYILVLMDGNGLFFKESFIQQGFEGGKKAAIALKTAILQQCGERAGEMDVVAKVFADFSSLSQALRRDGSLQRESDLKDFYSGFSQGQATFDFVDIGLGMERVDFKIQEVAKWNLRNYNCMQVVLGVSHNPNFTPFVFGLLQDGTTKSMVTILEGTPTVRELAVTNVNIVSFTDSLFRSDPLQDRTLKSPPPKQGLLPGATLLPAPSSTPVTAVPATSYAGVTANHAVSPPPMLNLPFAPKPAPAPAASRATKSPQWNPGKRGLDPPIQVNQAALDTIKKRRDSDKLCNNHYLRGPCAKGDACCFEHKYKPSPEEKVAIAFLARLNPCTNGQDCDTEDCIYGHHCPSTINGQCTHPYCKFRPDEHPTGTKYRPTYRNGDYSS